MHINLKLDIPKEYNDISKLEIAKLSMELKKIVDDLNFYLNCIDEENFTDKYNAKIEELIERISTLELETNSIDSRLTQTESGTVRKIKTTYSGYMNSSGGIINVASIKANDIVQVIPISQTASSYWCKFGGYVSSVDEGIINIRFNNPSSTSIRHDLDVMVIIY